MPSHTKHIAVVGGGVSGLVAAYLLHRRGHAVTLLEADVRPGGHTNTVTVDAPDGPWRVDTGFIVFNDRNYPRFEALLADLGVPGRVSDMSFSVSDGRDFEYNGAGPRGLFANRRHLGDVRFLRMVSEYARFNRDARALLASDEDPSLTEWLARLGYSRYFVDRLIVPQAAAVWSADPEQMGTFPARFLVEFFKNHGMLGLRDRPVWHTVVGGSRSYVDALLSRLPLGSVRLGTPVDAVRRAEDHVSVTPRGGEPERFDEVVLALHADDALALLADPSEAERELLAAFPYQANEAVLHADRALLPVRRDAWASWNYHLLDAPRPVSTVTYHMNRLQGLDAREEYCVTLNLSERIDPAKVIARFDYRHPVYTHAGMAAQRRHAEISGVRRTHYCGAYWGWGFHEDGVVSAHRVADAIAAAPASSPDLLAV